jgi:predicted DNA-binding protein with PD1-like motif
MEYICARLRRGDDLRERIEALAREHHLKAGAVVSAVGCVSRARIRDAGGVDIRDIGEDCEIVSLTGTVSEARCHLHLSLARRDLSVLGGHLSYGCVINTTCELVIARLDGWEFGVEQDGETGYDEILFHRV